MDVLLPKLPSHKPQAIRNKEIKNYLMMLQLYAIPSTVNMKMPQLLEDKNLFFFLKLKDSLRKDKMKSNELYKIKMIYVLIQYLLYNIQKVPNNPKMVSNSLINAIEIKVIRQKTLM